jgi:hypothetical protein
MTRHDTLQCVHEPFGDAYYFGPERLAERYENDPKARKESGYEESTYKTIFDRIARENSEVRSLILSMLLQYMRFPTISLILSSLYIQSRSYSRNLVNIVTIACRVLSAIHPPVRSLPTPPYHNYPIRFLSPTCALDRLFAYQNPPKSWMNPIRRNRHLLSHRTIAEPSQSGQLPILTSTLRHPI